MRVSRLSAYQHHPEHTDPLNDSFDPDKLHLTKKQILAIGDELVKRWMINPKANARMILLTKGAQLLARGYPDDALEAYYKQFWTIAFEVMQQNAMQGDPALSVLKQVKNQAPPQTPVERPIPRTPPIVEKKRLNFADLLGNGAMKDG